MTYYAREEIIDAPCGSAFPRILMAALGMYLLAVERPEMLGLVENQPRGLTSRPQRRGISA